MGVSSLGYCQKNDSKMRSNTERVKRIIRFIELLTVPSGIGAGAPFRMREFQRSFIHDVYSPCDCDGGRIVRRAVLSLARKNGKTGLIAALALTHLVGPEAIVNGEIYSAATEREQAALIYKVCSQIVRADPELNAMLKLVDSTKTIVNYENGTFFRALSAEAGSKYGLNPTVVIYDELAQARDRTLYDALDTSMGARKEPLFIAISTQSNDPQHILSQLIDDGLRGDDPTTVVHLYAVSEDADIWDEKNWYSANPALGDFRSLEDMRIMADRAKRMPSFEATFRNLYLNQRVDAQSPLIPRAEWVGCMDKDVKIDQGEEIYVGLDLSSTTDLTALSIVSAKDGDRCKSWFFKPKDLIADHETRDRVPYLLWVKNGIIIPTPGRTVDPGFVAKKLAELCSDFKILGVAYDRWRIDDLRRELDAIGVNVFVEGKDKDSHGFLRLVPWGQGFKDMAPAVDAFEISILERKFKHDGNPCLTWNVSNAISISDPAGNRKLDKSKTRFRIDGVVATVMAIGLKSRDISPAEPEYEMFVVG